MALLRRLRGLAGLALVGSVVWSTIGLTIAAIETTLRGQPIPWSLAPALAAVGAAAGCMFGLVLSVMERRRAFAGLTLWRTALWGGLGGVMIRAGLMAIGLVHNDLAFALVNVALYGFVGGAMSAGTLALARRAPAMVPTRSRPEIGDG